MDSFPQDTSMTAPAASELNDLTEGVLDAKMVDTVSPLSIPDNSDPDGDTDNPAAPVRQENDDKEDRAPIARAIATMEARVAEVGKSLTVLNQKFERHLVSNRHHEKIIDNLHSELQGYKEGHLRQLLTPIITDLVRLLDELSIAVNELPRKKEISVEQAVQSLSTFPLDVSYILERQGLEAFVAVPGEKFDPTRHRIIRRQSTEDPSADKTIAQSIRPGFIWEGKIFRPNFVAVYAYETAAPEGCKTVIA